MRVLRSRANSNDSHDELEEGFAFMKELAGEKEMASSSDARLDQPRIVATVNPPEHLADGEVTLAESPETYKDDVLWIKELLEESEYSSPEVPDKSVEPADVDTDTEMLSEAHDCDDVGVVSEEPKDESSVSELGDDGSEAYISGNASLYYLRGLLYHQRMNLDDAIRYLGKCLEMAVETDLFDYVVKSQIQLAAICLKRYRIHGNEKDYYSSLHYSENLIQIAKELELDELWTEALLLRAILRKIAKDVYGARDDLNQARAMAKSTGQDSVEILVEQELQEVRRLVARANRKKRLDTNNGDSMMDEALEAIPAIFDESLKLEVSRESLEISVELKRLVIMNLSSGLPLYTYSFNGRMGEKGDLVYGFLSALSHLASEVMDSPGMIRSISHEGSTVMMEHKEAYMAALFASREDFRARQSLQRFLREFLRLLPDMRLGEVLTQEKRIVTDEMIGRIFKAYL
jgi:tetratricopeptide (TPR) repeat protein